MEVKSQRFMLDQIIESRNLEVKLPGSCVRSLMFGYFVRSQYGKPPYNFKNRTILTQNCGHFFLFLENITMSRSEQMNGPTLRMTSKSSSAAN